MSDFLAHIVREQEGYSYYALEFMKLFLVIKFNIS